MADAPLPLGSEPTRVAQAETHGLNGLLSLAISVVVIAGLYFGRSVLLPVTLAVLLSFVLAPLANLLRRLWLGRIVSVLLAVLVALGIIGAIGGLIGTQVAGLAEGVPRYMSTIERKYDTVRSFAAERMTSLVTSLDRQLNQSRASTAGEPGQPATQTDNAAGPPKPIPVEVHQPNPSALEIAEKVISPAVEPLSTAAIVLIVTVFILLQREDLRDRLIRLFGSSDLHRTTIAMNDAARRLSRYFLTQLGINAAFGVVIGVGLYFIGVPSPVLWALIGMLLRFVPYIGAWLAVLGPAALAAAVDPGWSMLLWTAGLFAISEFLAGHALEPLLYGHSTGLSPVAVVIAAIFWTWLWGPIGLILSTPLTLCLVVLGRHVERMEFLDVLLGDRPALTLVESFYQRMLAGDPDEAHDQAEQFLKDRPLSAYYDEVAVEGLRLAANDSTRGVLTAAQLERIRGSIMDLIEDLDDHDDTQPAPDDPGHAANAQAVPGSRQDAGRTSAAPPDIAMPWRSEGAVLCIAGRGLLDEAASTMLAQLLGKHGIGARALRHSMVGRATIATLSSEGVRMICVSYLDLVASPSQIRYLLRRLRQRVPQVPILVGLWRDEGVEDGERLRSAIGADLYVGSLRESVAACLNHAHADVPVTPQPATKPMPSPLDGPAPASVGSALPA